LFETRLNRNMDLDAYGTFVKQLTSQESNDCDAFVKRLDELETNLELNTPLALTSCLGLSSEAGEFTEIIKKMIFQGKPYNEDVRFHLKRELGDILWYWANACRSLGFKPNEVMDENVKKLLARYPTEEFDTFFSNNRKDNDL